MSPIFPCVTLGVRERCPRGLRASRQFFHEVVYVVCVECLYMIKPMVVVLLFENLRSFWEKNCYQG